MISEREGDGGATPLTPGDATTVSPLRSRGSLTPVAHTVRGCVFARFFRRVIPCRGSDSDTSPRTTSYLHATRDVRHRAAFRLFARAPECRPVKRLAETKERRERDDARCSNLTSKRFEDRSEEVVVCSSSLRGYGKTRLFCFRASNVALSLSLSRDVSRANVSPPLRANPAGSAISPTTDRFRARQQRVAREKYPRREKESVRILVSLHGASRRLSADLSE